MRERFQAMLHEIEQRLVDEAGIVDRALEAAARAFAARDGVEAGRVVSGDTAVDRSEVAIERLCLDAMALQQPMAVDLRFVAAALKINSDLERMGDLATNVARQTFRLQRVPEARFADPLTDLATLARTMLQGAIESFVKRDTRLAREVWQSDAVTDAKFRGVLDMCLSAMKTGEASVEDASLFVAVARNVERFGDHAQNVAEDVIFVVEGRIVRHNVEGAIAPPVS